MERSKNKMKGFTLVELLAVIVILAIILVIAVPKVMSVIEDAKKATDYFYKLSCDCDYIRRYRIKKDIKRLISFNIFLFYRINYSSTKANIISVI